MRVESKSGQEMYELMERLYPLCRSKTGDGLRQSLQILGEYLPMEIHEVASGTPVLDWTVPKEWNIRQAFIKGPDGQKIIDFKDHSLHVVGYSVPVHMKMSRDELLPHLFSLPDFPEWIPYRNSFYEETWGFCLSHQQLEQLPEGEYEVLIDSSLEYGALSYGEYYLPGETEEEVLFSTHICHPSLANDNLSGMVVLTHLAKILTQAPRRLSYRFLFVPSTIGAITWLARNEDKLGNIKHGLVAALLGDAGSFTYKQSRQGDATIDHIVPAVLEAFGSPYQVREFIPFGYDERQFCSPGFNLPMGNLGRTPYGEFPEYHTSGDNLDFVKAEHLATSLECYFRICEALEANRTYINTQPKGEPQLGRRGLYEAVHAGQPVRDWLMAILWMLNLSDGEHSLLDITQRSGLPFSQLKGAVDILLEHGLLIPYEQN